MANSLIKWCNMAARVGICLAACTISAADARHIAGHASAVDGDTIRIGGRPLRLSGVDAPERRQICSDMQGRAYECGELATDALAAIVDTASALHCRILGRDRYGRRVGNCFTADGVDVAGKMVRDGYALEWTLYSHGVYADQERAAKEGKAGIWSGAFDNPRNWRR
ncbi:thermonuclease family protein [Rhizobium ruizarguesonis]